jgi:O-antigen/teichoic acid export membrane protein
MKFDKRQILGNVGSSWFSLGVNVVSGFILSPFIVHRLGDEAFGLWILIFSVTGYYGLFDLGIRSSIVRYVAKYSANEEYEDLNRLVNTAMFSYSAIGVVTMSVTLIAACYVNSIFKIQPDFIRTARWLLMMVGASVSLGFPLGVFSGILEGLQRFHVTNLTNVTSTTVRTILIIIALQHGGGLLSLAFITVTLPIINQMVNATYVFRHLPLAIGRRYVSRATLKLIAGYSGTTFLIIIGGRLRFKTDAMVIGTFVGAAAITYFTVGSRLVDYSSELVSSLAQIFIPMSSQSQAKGDLDGLRKILVVGNRACAFIIFPITAVLTVLGKSVIEAWMGPKYVAQSYRVLLILLYPMTLMLAQSASGRTLWGLAKHRTWAYVVLAEGISNLILSVILVRPYGIVGDAIGTAIPLACSMILFLPRHLCNLLGIRLRTYLSKAYLLPLALNIPLVGCLLLMQRWYIPHHLTELLIQLMIAGAVYGVGLAWAFWTRRAWDVGQLAANDEDAISMALVETYQEEA